MRAPEFGEITQCDAKKRFEARFSAVRIASASGSPDHARSGSHFHTLRETTCPSVAMLNIGREGGSTLRDAHRKNILQAIHRGIFLFQPRDIEPREVDGQQQRPLTRAIAERGSVQAES